MLLFTYICNLLVYIHVVLQVSTYSWYILPMHADLGVCDTCHAVLARDDGI